MSPFEVIVCGGRHCEGFGGNEAQFTRNKNNNNPSTASMAGIRMMRKGPKITAITPSSRRRHFVQHSAEQK